MNRITIGALVTVAAASAVFSTGFSVRGATGEPVRPAAGQAGQGKITTPGMEQRQQDHK